MRAVLFLLAATLVAACSVPGPREPERYFILEAAPAPEAGPRAAVRLVVAPTAAASFYDTQEIAYSREPGVRAYYQFNRWTERPQRSIHGQLESRLGGGDPATSLRLNTRLEEIYHDAAQPPGTARITVSAELVDPSGRAVLARRSFTRDAPAASYDAPGAVRGFNQALAALLGDIEAWAGAGPRAERRP